MKRKLSPFSRHAATSAGVTCGNASSANARPAQQAAIVRATATRAVGRTRARVPSMAWSCRDSGVLGLMVVFLLSRLSFSAPAGHSGEERPGRLPRVDQVALSNGQREALAVVLAGVDSERLPASVGGVVPGDRGDF